MEEFRSVLSRLPVVLMSRVARGRPKEGEIDTTWVAAIYTQMTFPPSFSVLAVFFHLYLFLFFFLFCLSGSFQRSLFAPALGRVSINQKDVTLIELVTSCFIVR